MNKILFLIVLLFVSNVFAQDSLRVVNPVETDTLKLQLHLNDAVNNAELLNLQNELHHFQRIKFFDESYFEMMYGNDLLGKNLNELNMELIQNDLMKYMRMQVDFQRKMELGVFGQVLGYANTAAVIALAIIHINKYGFK